VATGGVCAFVGDDRRDSLAGKDVVADSPRPVADRKVHSQYEQVSRDLFAAVMLACVASANSDLTMTP
jgi:hypothetical protein